mmetsp:Transcript_44355/g.102456  ORF Transcript_44355/g.102456 Transcript_44355/m.102456 type:complete len:85 (-) Transcript_44355:4-258(-)
MIRHAENLTQCANCAALLIGQVNGLQAEAHVEMHELSDKERTLRERGSSLSASRSESPSTSSTELDKGARRPVDLGDRHARARE